MYRVPIVPSPKRRKLLQAVRTGRLSAAATIHAMAQIVTATPARVAHTERLAASLAPDLALVVLAFRSS